MNELCRTFPKSLEIALNKSETVSAISESIALHLLSIRDTLINYDVDDLETLDRVLD